MPLNKKIDGRISNAHIERLRRAADTQTGVPGISMRDQYYVKQPKEEVGVFRMVWARNDPLSIAQKKMLYGAEIVHPENCAKYSIPDECGVKSDNTIRHFADKQVILMRYPIAGYEKRMALPALRAIDAENKDYEAFQEVRDAVEIDKSTRRRVSRRPSENQAQVTQSLLNAVASETASPTI